MVIRSLLAVVGLTLVAAGAVGAAPATDAQVKFAVSRQKLFDKAAVLLGLSQRAP